jgi:hypothetical protein
MNPRRGEILPHADATPTQAAYKGTLWCCRANMAHIRESRPDYGLSFQVKELKTLYGVSSSLESGAPRDTASRNTVRQQSHAGGGAVEQNRNK